MKKRRVVVAAIVLVAIAALLIKGKSLLNKRMEQIEKEPTPSKKTLWVSIVQGKMGTLQQKRSVLAQVVAHKSITLSTTLPGYIKEVTVSEGQRVKRGDLLVRIDSYELQAEIAALQKTLAVQKSDLALAKSVYERNEKLVAVGGISKEAFDASRVAVQMKASVLENTKQTLSKLQHRLSYLEIKAPFDGVIERIVLHEGDLAVVGKPVLSMNDAKQKLLFSYAPTAHMPIKKDQEVYLKHRRIGFVKSLYPTAQNGLHVAEVALGESLALPVGSSVNVDVLVKEARGCILPDTTVVHKKEGDYVMVYKEGRFTPQKVHIVLVSNNRILLEACPASPVAVADEAKLSTLPAYDNIGIIGADDAR